MFIFSSAEPDSHYWFMDSAALSHICGDRNLFDEIEDTPPITIEIASRDTFKANKWGLSTSQSALILPAIWKTCK